MCLGKAKKITTEEDIVCYKVFEYNFGRLESPFYHTRYRLGEKKRLKRKDPEMRGLKVLNSNGKVERSYSVYGGAYHSLAHYVNAMYLAQRMSSGNRSSCVVKCIIPKSSKYIYQGEFDDVTAYASQQLLPVSVESGFQNGFYVPANEWLIKNEIVD